MNDPGFSTTELALRAARALVNWGKAGFTTTDEETVRRRLSVCLGCPHMMRAPNRLAYQFTCNGETDPRICVLCGCMLSWKVRLASETCPDQDPDHAGFSRWGEPIGR
jgi:hypothetical protein